MGLSEAANNAIGALSGAILAACLVPQLVRMARTRSAQDLSYLFLIFYNIGLVLMAVYLIYSDATVGWITIIIELVLGMATLAGKVYLDAKFTSDRRLHVAEKGKSIPESRNIFSSHICTHFFIECDMMTQNSEEGMLDQKKALIMALEQVLMEAGLERVTTMNYPTSRDSNSTNVTVLGVEDGYVCVSWSRDSTTAILNFFAFKTTDVALKKAASSFEKEMVSRGSIAFVRKHNCAVFDAPRRTWTFND